MGISLKRPIDIIECDQPFDEIDISFLFEIDDAMFVPLRHHFFDSREIGCMMAGSIDLSFNRNGTDTSIRPILFFDVKEPKPGIDDPKLTIIVDKGTWPKRVYVRSDDCSFCKKYEHAECISCKCILNGIETVIQDIHRKCSGSIPDAVKSLIVTLERVWNIHKQKESTEAFSTLIRNILGEDAEFETIPDIPNMIKLSRKTDKVTVVEEVEPVLPEPVVDLPEDWYVCCGEIEDSIEIHFTYNDSKRYRTFNNLDIESARTSLVELYKLLNNESSNDKVANKVLRSLRSADKHSETLATYSAVLSETERELAAVKAELEDVKQQLFKSQQTVIALNQLRDKVSCDVTLPLNCTLDNLFPNEILYHVISSLRSYYDSHYSDTDRIIRRAEVIKNIIDNNFVSDLRAEMKDGLYAAYYDKDVRRSKTLGDLNDLGFECSTNGEGHVTIYPKGHPEYSYSLASTPSDYRTRDNEISHILRKLF